MKRTLKRTPKKALSLRTLKRTFSLREPRTISYSVSYSLMHQLLFGTTNCTGYSLTLSWRRPLSYRNQSIDLLRKCISYLLMHPQLFNNSFSYSLANIFISHFLVYPGIPWQPFRVLNKTLHRRYLTGLSECPSSSEYTMVTQNSEWQGQS